MTSGSLYIMSVVLWFSQDLSAGLPFHSWSHRFEMRNTEVFKLNQQNTITKGLLGFQGVLGSHQTIFANSVQDFKA